MTPRLPLIAQHVAEIFHFMFLSGGDGHFENRPLADLAITFERYRGDKLKFALKWFSLGCQINRGKVGKNGHVGIKKNDSATLRSLKCINFFRPGLSTLA